MKHYPRVGMLTVALFSLVKAITNPQPVPANVPGNKIVLKEGSE